MDFALLLAVASRCLSDRLTAAHEEADLGPVRPAHGFVIRALAAEPLTLTALAERLGMTKQAAMKVVDEMEGLGLLRREQHGADRRAKLLRLTSRGEAVRANALRTSEQIESELIAELGAERLAAARAALERFVALHGADPQHARWARPSW
jgi:DNA-binding MarR family transcriptional regulator